MPDLFDTLKKLTPIEEAFVHEYVVDMNGTQACIRAGYSPDNATEQAQKLFKRPNVMAAIERIKAQRLSRVGVTQDTVLHEMSLLAQSSLTHYVVDEEGNIQLAEGAPEGAMRAIQSIKRRVTVKYDPKTEEVTKVYDVELKLWDKPGALRLMGKHTGLFPDRMEHTGKGGGPIEQVARIERVIVDPPGAHA